MPPQKCVVFVPAHNEAESLEKVLIGVRARARAHLAALVVVDDGSTDKTAEVAARHTRHVIKTGSKSGNGKATRVALQYIAALPGSDSFDSVIRLDGDGQHDPDMLGHLITLIEEGCDIAVCSRFHPQSDTSEVRLNRNVLNLSAALWMQEATGLNITDARSGFFGYRWRLLAPVIDDLKTDGYGIPMELLLRVFQDCRIRREHIRHQELPHPARYGRDLQTKLQVKWDTESIADQVERMRTAYDVYLSTCTELGIGRPADQQAAAADPSWLETTAPTDASTNGVNAK